MRWFREGLLSMGVEGRVIAADADLNAPSQAEADQFVCLPSVEGGDYAAALLDLCASHLVTFAISVNDFELSAWSRLDKADFLVRGTRLICLRPDTQAMVEDKHRMASSLGRHGIRVPLTMLGTDVLGGAVERERLGPSIVIKNRFGSGLSGLTFTTQRTLDSDLETAARAARDRVGAPVPDVSRGLECLVVQPAITGTEFGMDVVSDFGENFAGVLVRRKISMRGGETDQAQSEGTTRFRPLGERVAAAIPHVGLIDTDVIEDPAGEQWLIDVNPRFGGGYPFSHLAGANAPMAYVWWSRGHDAGVEHLEYETDVVSSKYPEAAVVFRGRPHA